VKKHTVSEYSIRIGQMVLTRSDKSNKLVKPIWVDAEFL